MYIQSNADVAIDNMRGLHCLAPIFFVNDTYIAASFGLMPPQRIAIALLPGHHPKLKKILQQNGF